MVDLKFDAHNFLICTNVIEDIQTKIVRIFEVK